MPTENAGGLPLRTQLPVYGTALFSNSIPDLVLGYGDFYGPEVNLAARLVNAAEPGQILLTADIAARAEESDAIAVEAFGVLEVAGFDERVEIASLDRPR